MLSRPAWPLLGLSLPAAALAMVGLSHVGWPSLRAPDAGDLPSIIVIYSLLPRIAVALLAGAALGLSGGLAQVALRNPLASPGTLGVAAGAALVSRPLGMLDLPDAVARGLGVPVGLVRAAALAVSVGLAASVVGQVGVIGFVGLAAPALARLGGLGRRMLLWSPLLGAGLLLLSDQVVQLLSGADGALLPTGAISALFGVPLLLWLLPRVAATTTSVAQIAGRQAASAGPALLVLGGLVVGVALVGLLAGRSAESWAWSAGLLEQRAPRVAAAGIAGVVLALSGTVLQRVLGNPMASPEVLGLGTGAVAGGAVALWLGLGGFAARFGFGAAGAGGVLALLLLFGRGNATQIVLAGIAVSAAGEAATALLLASGDPRAELVLLWLSGSTYGVAPATIGVAAVLLLAGVAACSVAVRWLEVLPLGATVAGALGLPVVRARRLMLLLATLLTAFGAVLAGPLSFIGLVAPHVARLLGLHRAGAQLAAAGLAGAGLLIAADWLGRTLLFPSEIPAGMLAALLGGPVLLAALARGRA